MASPQVADWIKRYGTDGVIVADSPDGVRSRLEMLLLTRRLDKLKAERLVVNADAALAASQKCTSLAPASNYTSGNGD